MKIPGAGIVALGVVLAGPAHPAAAQDAVTFDVVLTDAQSRPIKAINPADLELTVGGEPQSVDAVRLESGAGRVIGIFLDEFHVRAGEATERARAALTQLVDTLRDQDMVALVKPLDPLHAITFTQDRALLRKMVAAFEGHAGDYTPRTEFERNFMSRDPKTAEATRAQVVSAALQSLARRLGDQQQGRKALIFVAEGFRPAQPRAIVFAANSNGVAMYALDPDSEPSDNESILRSIAEQTGGTASINEPDLGPAVRQAVADLDYYFVLSFTPQGPGDGRFHAVQVRLKQPGALARTRSGYWAPDAARVAAAAKVAASRNVQPFKPSRSSPYIRPWIGMARGPDGLTNVTVTWEPGAAPPRNQRVASILVKAIATDGTVLFESRIGAGDVDRATFNAPPGYIALEMGLQSSSGAALDTDYRSLSIPNLKVTRPTFATPQVFRMRTARDFSEMSQRPDAVPVASRTFSRTERLIVRAAAYGAGDRTLAITAQLLNRKGIPMRQLRVVEGPLPPGTVQFDLPLSSLAPDEYRVELATANPDGPRDEAKEIISFRVTN